MSCPWRVPCWCQVAWDFHSDGSDEATFNEGTEVHKVDKVDFNGANLRSELEVFSCHLRMLHALWESVISSVRGGELAIFVIVFPISLGATRIHWLALMLKSDVGVGSRKRWQCIDAWLVWYSCKGVEFCELLNKTELKYFYHKLFFNATTTLKLRQQAFGSVQRRLGREGCCIKYD